jgi:hypothetical protein
VLERLDSIRAHLCRSALLAARLQLKQVNTATETLSTVGFPSLAINDRGRVLSRRGIRAATS